MRAAFEKGRELNLKPLSVVVLDSGGNVLAFERQNGASAGQFQIADGKTSAAVMMGVPSSALMERAEQKAYFVAALSGAYGGRFIPVPGGALVKDNKGLEKGVVGVTGDASESDALYAIAGIEAAVFTSEA